MVYTKLDSFPAKKSCNFCQTRITNEYQLGHIASLQDIAVHYFCLLLSGEVQQRGRDEQGILGFLPVDIKKEITRGKKLFCEGCGKNGATLRCAFSKCTAVFHLPCGLKRGAISQFYKQFLSWCVKHRPTQTVHPKVRREATECPICREGFSRDPHLAIWPTCCRPPSSMFHRFCLQRMALVAGSYHYRCPLCNERKKFITESHRLGVYIPEQEAQWELGGAYEDLTHQRLKCEALRCHCPRGNEYDRPNSKWKLEKCGECGLNATHLQCSGVWKNGSSFWTEWTCSTCLPIIRPHEQQRSITDSMEAQHSRADLDELFDSERSPPTEVRPRFLGEISHSMEEDPRFRFAEPFRGLTVGLKAEGSDETHFGTNLVRPETPECLKNRIVIIDDSDDDDVVCISDDDDIKPVPVAPAIEMVAGYRITHSAIGYMTGDVIEIE